MKSEASARRSPATEIPMITSILTLTPAGGGGPSGRAGGEPEAGMITVTAIGGGSVCVGEPGDGGVWLWLAVSEGVVDDGVPCGGGGAFDPVPPDVPFGGGEDCFSEDDGGGGVVGSGGGC